MDEQDMASQSQPVLPPKSGTPAAAPAGMVERPSVDLGVLAKEIALAEAGQSNIMSCLLWAFANYGRLAPPKEGFVAYDDPEGATVAALMSAAEVAAKFFGYAVAEPALSTPA